MLLSDLEMAITCRIPYGTRITGGMGNMHTRIGDLAASEPEKKVTLYQGCCSSQQTALTAMSLTHCRKKAGKGKDAIPEPCRRCEQCSKHRWGQA